MTMTVKALVSATLAAFLATAAAAQDNAISLRDSFPLGSNELCSAQLQTPRQSDDIFDRRYAVTCRDAVAAVGRLAVLRESGAHSAQDIAGEGATCTDAASEAVQGLGEIQVSRCRREDVGVEEVVYIGRSGGKIYAATGFSGYASALRIGLRTIAGDRPVAEAVEIALTEAGDAAAFARLQARSLSREAALGEAYRRNNSGNYAEAAEFFASATQTGDGGADSTEALLNEALQQSNLGNLVRAEELFQQATAPAAGDPVLARLLRNYMAIHLLNARAPQEALETLSQPLAPSDGGSGAALDQLVIDAQLAERLSAEGARTNSLVAGENTLLPTERAQILDGQADYIRGTIYRLEGRRGEAVASLNSASATLAAVRRGRVASALWMRAQIAGELAAIAEQQSDLVAAERLYRDASALVATAYPESPALLNSNAQLAAFLARSGRGAEAIEIYRAVVEKAADTRSPSLRQRLAPYFRLLSERGTESETAADMFAASQVLVRPGVAQTQAVLARELSGGSDEASGLFRQSLDLSRDVERTRTALAGLVALEEPNNADTQRVGELQARLTGLERQQVAIQSELSEYPRYRVLSGKAITLQELQATLREGEAYAKLTVFETESYGIFITPDRARAYRVGAGEIELGTAVNAIRDTISVVENGQRLTYPFDVEMAHALYEMLFGPVDAELRQTDHLIFEPDSVMLSLPPNLLIASRSEVDSYLARAGQPGGDPFDYRGIGWLGRDTDVTTTVSARSFRDIRNARPSDAANSYLGFGENTPVGSGSVLPAGARSYTQQSSSCQWSINAWSRPISSAELSAARGAIARNGGNGGEVIVGASFTDTNITTMEAIDDFRVIHFATHGLVAPPAPQCPPRPALLTSFGGEGSDGLLSFAEIFDLDLDADLIILSACDTASAAGVSATREAGVITGGSSSLDGLVRAFVGAGGRSVVASHWPVPDDFSATQRLISGLFTAPTGTSTAEALRLAQNSLMDAAETSHPYYWSAFAIVGDGAVAVVQPAS